MLRRLLSLLVAASAASGCYDWTLGAAPRDAGSDGSRAADAGEGAAPHDAAIDRHADAVGLAEAAAPPDVTSSAKDAPPDGPSCTALRAAVDQAKAAAKNCSTAPAGACEAHLPDQCHCVVFVAQASSSATASYAAAVHALEASGCPLGCATCPVPPGGSLCLSSEVGGMLTDVCQP